MSKDDQFASYDSRLKSLAARVAGLEGAISNELSIKQANQSSLEELIELHSSDDKRDIVTIGGIQYDLTGYKHNIVSDSELPMGCQGDQLGQCEPGCDGVSKRGSCLDEEWAISQCGQFSSACKQCSPAMRDTTLWYPLTSGVKQCKYESAPLSPVDNVQSCSIEKYSECDLLADSCDRCDEEFHRLIMADEETERQSGPDVRPCKYEAVRYEHVSPYAHVAPREPVDNDDTKYGKGGDSRLEGSSEGRDSEQKANMSFAAVASMQYEQWKAWHDGLCDAERARYAEYVCSDGPVLRAAWGVDSPVAPVQVVYCCNGAMYEAR